MSTNVVRTRADDDGVAATVIRAVAAATDAEPHSMTPLYQVLDPDALEAVFAPSLDGASRPGGRVVFEYEGCEVSVLADGEIRVRPPAEAT